MTDASAAGTDPGWLIAHRRENARYANALAAAAARLPRDRPIAARPLDVIRTLLAARRTSAPEDHVPAVADATLVDEYLRIVTTDEPASLVRQAQVDWAQAMQHGVFARPFIAALDARARALAPALADRVDLTDRRRLLDIGGGSGRYACVFAQRHRRLEAIVLEQPAVAPAAEDTIDESSVRDRVRVHIGDMFTDPLPEGCDVHLFSNVLHDWGVDDVRCLLHASCRALESGGLLVIHDACVAADKTGPRGVAEYSARLLHATRGKCYSTAEYAAFCREAGFEPGEYAATIADWGVLTARRR